MTTTVADRPVAPVARVGAGGVLSLLVLIAAPALIAVLRLIVPYVGTDSDAAAVRAVAAHQSTQNAVIWLGFAAALTLPVAAVLAGRLFRAAAPRLTTVAEVLLVPAYLCVSWLVALDAVMLYGVRHGLGTDVVADMSAGLHPVANVGIGVFVVGHVLGTVLLGVVALRTRLIPTWAGVALTISQPVHFVALVFLGNPVLDCIGWSLNAVAFGVIGWRLLRR